MNRLILTSLIILCLACSSDSDNRRPNPLGETDPAFVVIWKGEINGSLGIEELLFPSETTEQSAAVLVHPIAATAPALLLRLCYPEIRWKEAGWRVAEIMETLPSRSNCNR